jgi:hypothetical protein
MKPPMIARAVSNRLAGALPIGSFKRIIDTVLANPPAS